MLIRSGKKSLYTHTELKLCYSWKRRDRFNESNITEHANFVNNFFFPTKLTCARKIVLQITTTTKKTEKFKLSRKGGKESETDRQR